MKRLRTISVLSSIYLALFGFLGIHFKSYAQQVHYDPQCIDFGPKIWNKQMLKNYAISYMKWQFPEWNRSEHKALMKLWGKESAWNHEADNPNSTAYGVAQVLNTEPGTPAPLQVERGLAYIVHRYEKPSVAWSHHRKNGWY
jgi:hypothetical protein